MIRHTVAPLYLLACLLLGGASAAGIAANLLLEIAAIPLICWSLWSLTQTGVPSRVRTPLLLLALLVILALCQLIPLPPQIWTKLPGRGFVAQNYDLLGLALPWLPLTLSPVGTVAAIVWLLPAFAALLLIIVMGAFRGRLIAIVIIGVTLVSVPLGAVQVLGARDAYFYHRTNFGAGVGFFANPNHNATLILVCIPFLAALQLTLLRRATLRKASAIRLLILSAYATILVGALVNGSLAGVGLAVPVTLVTFTVFGTQRTVVRRGMLIGTVLASVVALLIIVIGPFGNNLFGEQKKNVEGARKTVFAVSWQAAVDYFPFGSGTGTFQPVYHTMEPLSSITTTYRNHVHNDWIELLLETGATGIVFAAMFILWWGLRVRAIWAAEEPDRFAQAAAISTATIMMHSLVDYPLRTAALSAVFAMCLGLMSGVRPYVRPRKLERTARHLTI